MSEAKPKLLKDTCPPGETFCAKVPFLLVSIEGDFTPDEEEALRRELKIWRDAPLLSLVPIKHVIYRSITEFDPNGNCLSYDKRTLVSEMIFVSLTDYLCMYVDEQCLADSDYQTYPNRIVVEEKGECFLDEYEQEDIEEVKARINEVLQRLGLKANVKIDVYKVRYPAFDEKSLCPRRIY